LLKAAEQRFQHRPFQARHRRVIDKLGVTRRADSVRRGD
jgi:hypothetical protein